MSTLWVTLPLYFFVFLLVFGLCSMSTVSWSGLFLYCDSSNYVFLIMLSLFILGMVLLSEKNNMMMVLSNILVFFCLIFFLSSNMLMLYMYFELSMFPILVMILGYGSQIEKINSSYYLMIYASLCSFPFLYIYFLSDYYIIFCYYDCFVSWEGLFFLSLGFLMKFPVYFLHLWLPKAHVEAPTTASMLLAGLLLKLGTVGFLRILVSFNYVNLNFWVFLSFFGMIVSSFCCIFQSDSKSLAAYSSVCHMSFLLFSLILMLLGSKTSSLLLMLAHGYTSTLMFYFIGEIYHVMGNRLIYFMSGLFGCSSLFGVCFFSIFLSNMGVPPCISFFSEFMTISLGFLFFNSYFLLMFFYFLISFYYSMYFFVNGLVGTGYVNVNVFNVGFTFPLIFMSYNFFWVSLFY